MYETVKEVNNHRIYRMKGTHGVFHVDIRKGVSATFKTIKAASDFCETLK